jgi:hypothetical protein
MANRRSGQRNPQSLMVSLLDVAFILLRLAIKACSEAKVVERRMGMPTEGQYGNHGGKLRNLSAGGIWLVKICAVCTGAKVESESTPALDFGRESTRNYSRVMRTH